MKCVTVLLVLICSEVCLVSSEEKEDENNNDKEEEARVQNYGPVIFVNLLYRHGDRTPIRLYPNDPNKNSEKWNIGLGQLNKEGCLRHYRLGQWIRENYRDWLPSEYNYRDIYVASSDSDRCIMSAQCNLAGLYGVNNTNKLHFQPIPIHTRPKHIDKMIYLNASCATYDEESNHLLHSLSYKYDLKYKDLFENLTKHTGRHIGDINEVSQIYDTLKVEEEHGYVRAEWAKPYYPEPLLTVSKDSFLYKTKTNFMKRIKGGPLLTDMLSHITEKANGTLKPDRKMWIYSGHDDTILTLLDTLHLLQEPLVLPSYATMMALQLRRKGRQYYITILYKDGNEDKAHELYMEGCNGETCKLERFVNITKQYMITDEQWNDECVLDKPAVPGFDSRTITMGWTVMVIMMLGISCLILLYFKYFKPRNTKYYYKLKLDPY